MDYIKGIDVYCNKNKTAITLGKFDGLHLGHQKLITLVQNHSSDDVKSVVCAFDMTPLYTENKRKSESLMTNLERYLYLENKVDILVECPFTKKFGLMTAEAFIENVLVKQFHAKYIIVGDDFSFGYKKEGTVRMLIKYSKQYEYHVIAVKKEKINGQIISSTNIKNELKLGHMSQVSKLLGYPYTIAGKVEHGRKLGRTLGFPTMNITTIDEKLLPPNGVYISTICIDGINYQGLTNIGTNPTVTTKNEVLIESYLFDYKENAYGKMISVKLHAFKRIEKKFKSIELLKKQMEDDIKSGKAYFSDEKER